MVSRLAPGDVVTTLNTVDKVVTEWGVAELAADPFANEPDR